MSKLNIIKEIREETGASIGEINKALAETGDDKEKAIELLRKMGQKIAAKKADRATNEGSVKVKISDDGKKGSMVSVACETDFVARNEDFQQLVAEISTEVYENGEEKVGLMIQEAMTKIGENMQLKQSATLTVDQGVVDGYVHGNGKVGVLVALETDKAEAVEAEDLKNLAHEIALQIAATNPSYLSPDQVSAEEINKEKEIYKEVLLGEGKPAEMVDKIVAGKIGKYYAEVCLLKQPYIKDDKIKIEDLIQQTAVKLNAHITVKDFIRFSL